MHKKTIKKILEKKHADFVASIKDEAIAKLVKENSIITGGSIASMLLKEPVNDYDYYFTDLDTTKKVAEYFVRQFIESHPDFEIEPEVIVYEGRVKIKIPSAGVAGENNDDSDYQYFETRPDEEAEAYVEKVISDADEIDAKTLEDKEPYRPVYLTSNAITLSDHVQLVIRFYGDAEDIHKNYDFVHCTNYWVSKNSLLILRKPALESLLSKHLFYSGSLYPLCSIIRTRKFIKRGWHINAGQYLKMCFQLSELDLKDIAVLEDQLVGVDSAYFKQVIDLCKEKQEKDLNFSVTMPYLISIVDKIF